MALDGADVLASAGSHRGNKLTRSFHDSTPVRIKTIQSDSTPVAIRIRNPNKNPKKRSHQGAEREEKVSVQPRENAKAIIPAIITPPAMVSIWLSSCMTSPRLGISLG